MIFVRIAWHNLLRNSRRTISTAAAVLIGIAVIVFINGFNDGISTSWADSIINGQSGHFRLQHKAFSEYASTDMERILMSDPNRLKEELKQNPHIVSTASRIMISGLAGQDRKSTSFFGAAYEMEELDRVLPDFNRGIVEGKPLEPGDPMGAVLGKALAESLDAKIGDELVILANSIYAEQNAIVVYIKGLIRIPGAIRIEQNLILTSIDQVQEDLLDIDSGVMEILVRIDDDENLEQVIEWVNNRFAAQDQPWVAVPWYDDQRYRQVVGMFHGIALVITVILSMLVGIVISNALLMSIFERVREIGTIRALGTEKQQVYRLFFAEAIMVTFFGTVFGLVLGVMITWITGQFGIPVPGLAEGLPIFPQVVAENVLKTGVLPIVIVLVAAFFPIRASCKMDVIEALNYR